MSEADVPIDRLKQELQRLEKDLERLQAESRRKLDLANAVHRSLLPRPVRDSRIHIDVRYLPVEQVGGDYCQVRFYDETTCYVTMCDVAGHGIGPALLATRVSSEVRHYIAEGYPPRNIVESLNRFIYNNFSETELFLTFIATRLDLAERRITWSGAGHPPVIRVPHDAAQSELLESQNTLIGVMEQNLEKVPETTLQLSSGDRILFYTDGLTEVADSSGRLLGVSGLQNLATESSQCEIFDTADYILQHITDLGTESFQDDMTLIVAEIK